MSIVNQQSIGHGKCVKVFVNGRWVGTHNNADDLVKSIKDLRRSMEIPKEISIVRDISNKEVRFFTDPGRVQRPLFIVKNSEIVLRKHHIQKLQSRNEESINFDETLKLGLCEFLDVEEEETTMIAMHISDLRNKGS